jgi:hypothetical protein
LFPVYRYLARELEKGRGRAQRTIEEIRSRHVDRRLVDLERLTLQGKLILAETYLEDRELLRARIHSAGTVAEKEQRQYDADLVGMLEQAVKVVDEARDLMPARPTNLEFRQT